MKITSWSPARPPSSSESALRGLRWLGTTPSVQTAVNFKHETSSTTVRSRWIRVCFCSKEGFQGDYVESRLRCGTLMSRSRSKSDPQDSDPSNYRVTWERHSTSGFPEMILDRSWKSWCASNALHTPTVCFEAKSFSNTFSRENRVSFNFEKPEVYVVCCEL